MFLSLSSLNKKKHRPKTPPSRHLVKMPWRRLVDWAIAVYSSWPWWIEVGLRWDGTVWWWTEIQLTNIRRNSYYLQGFSRSIPGGKTVAGFSVHHQQDVVVFFGVSWESKLADANAFWKEACVLRSQIGVPLVHLLKTKEYPLPAITIESMIFLGNSVWYYFTSIQVKWFPFISATFHTGNLHKGEAGS